MPKGGDVINTARRLRRISKKAFAETLRVSENTLWRLEHDAAPVVAAETYAEAAKLLELTFDWVSQQVLRPENMPTLPAERRGRHAASTPDREYSEADRRPVSDFPTFDHTVSASRWSEAIPFELDYDDPAQRVIIETGRFRLRIKGDCMAPKFPDGCTVEFVIQRAYDAPALKAAYGFCRNDDTSTFKRLVEVTADEYVLECINRRKYPGRMRVARQEISRVARAVAVIQPV